MKSIFTLHTFALVCLFLQTTLAAAAESAAEKQRRLIAILQSDAPPQDKAIPCKQLAIYGDKEAVPALAPLLADTNLASWARIALEAIPGPEADQALRAALPKLQGLLLIGVINSLGVRRDTKAVEALAGKLTATDLEIVAAAAAALGKISGSEAAKALSQALATAREETRPAVAEGVILCAEQFLAEDKFAEATPLYDAVRKADVPLQRRLEATRGAILARQSDGLPLLMEQLRSPSRAEFAMALRTARELKGREVTAAIAAEMDQAGPEREVMLLLALADRNDPTVFPRLLQAAEKSSPSTRVAALTLLDRFGDPAAVPVLLNAASESDTNVATSAKATLTRMEGKAVDTELLDRLPQASGRTRQLLIELAALRRIDAALPAVASSITDPDPAVRRAAFTTLGTLGSEKQTGELIALFTKTPEANERDAIERTLTTISARTGTRSLPHILPLVKHKESDLRLLAIRALATIGGPEALAAVISALNDPDEEVVDEAVGTLATWPNNWPDDATVAEPLLNLVKSGKNRSHQVQGVRGYLLYVNQNEKLSNADKVKAIDQLLPLLKQTPEKRLAVSALGAIPTAQSLESLVPLAADPAIAEEACLAIVNVASAKNVTWPSKDVRKQALQTALDRSKNDATRKKATDALKAIQ